MDIVLEVFDTFLCDYLYAAALPVKSAAQFVSSLPASGLNGTQALHAAHAGHNGYVYNPASVYLYLEPSKYAYLSAVARDNVWRQSFTLFMITWIFGFFVYFGFASFSYFFVFDKTTMNHPRFLKGQIRMEIRQAMEAMPAMSLCTIPFFVLEVRGYSKMYDSFDEAPFPMYNLLQFPAFLLFTDFLIYWIHRGLHHPLIYKRLHKPHHKWIMPTPYASHAFHPLDGWAQSLPYHIFPFVFPLQKMASVLLFVGVNIWTIMIHDGEFVANNPIINGAACHSLHHEGFNWNYGQYSTLWDRLGNSYRKPGQDMYNRDVRMGKQEWDRQVKAVEKIVKEVEGEDDRAYAGDDAKKVQ